MVKAGLYIVGGLAVLILVGVLAWNWDPFGRLKHAKAEAVASTQQATNATEAVRQVDHYSHETTIIREKADQAASAIQKAPNATDPLPADLRDAWAAGIDGLRVGPDQTDPRRR